MRAGWELVSAMFDDISDLVALSDQEATLVRFNPAMERFLGVPSAQPREDAWVAVRAVRDVSGRLMKPAEAPLRRVLAGERVDGVELTMTSMRGGRRTVVTYGQRFPDAETGVAAVLVFHDVTEHRRAAARRAYGSLHDGLTHLPNRALFADHARTALERGRRRHTSTAVLCIDLDHFSDLNARLGSEAGDRILVEVARRLRRAVRAYDSAARGPATVARAGGDEFLVLCEGVASPRIAAAIADRLATAVAEPMIIAGQPVAMTASIGITLTRDGDPDAGVDVGADVDALMVEADTAMRRAKRRGEGRQEFFADAMRMELAKRSADERALRRAIDGGELRVHFQPKVSVATERIVGVEALLRWEHPERGLVPPADFIPLAEETGLIVPMGRWVLEQACRQAEAWRSRFPDRPPLTVSVNVSTRQFDAELVATVRTALAETGLDPTSLCLEVTESVVMGDVESAIATLGALKRLGVSISIDDFGTGYSSLAYLKRFPLNELKVDKSFVDGLGRDPESTAIVAAVIATAHALDLTVVAEGLETETQLTCLQNLGCEMAQGYHFHRPQPAAAIEELLTAEEEARTDTRRARYVGRPQTIHHGFELALVVDDAADVRYLAHVSLAAAGFEVHEAETGEAALELARLLHPDCVILDVRLPNLSGFDVCRRLRADPATRHTTIVMLTADGEASGKAEAFLLEADDYIVKPFAPRDLVSRVRSAMGRREQAGRADPLG